MWQSFTAISRGSWEIWWRDKKNITGKIEDPPYYRTGGLMRDATAVQVLQDLFYVLSQQLVVAAIILSFIVYVFIACFILLVIAAFRRRN